MATIPTTFDPLFEQYGQGIPVAFLRALGWHESRLNPLSRTGPSWGLLQIMESVRMDYNKGRGAAHSRDDLLKPEVNIQIGADLLNTIAHVLEQAGAPKDWREPEWVKLVTASWNSGWSRAAGVPMVLEYLRSNRLPLTHDNVFAHSATAGATRHLRNPKKRDWQRKVAETYFSFSRDQPNAPARTDHPSGGALWLLLIAGLWALSTN